LVIDDKNSHVVGIERPESLISERSNDIKFVNCPKSKGIEPIQLFSERSSVDKNGNIPSGMVPVNAFEETFKLLRLRRFQITAGKMPVRKFDDRSNSSSESDNKGDNMCP
jgi:hypothetical protein